MPTTNGTGSRRASSLFSFGSNPMVSGYASSESPATPPKRFEPLSPRARSPGVFDRAHSSGGIQFSLRRRGLVAELVEQVAGRLLELGVLGLAHLASSTPPPGRPAAAWWSARERRRARPPRARGGPSSPAAPRPSPAGARRRARSSASITGSKSISMCSQTRRSVALGVRDHVLVTDLEVVLDLVRVDPRLDDPLAPPPRHLARRHRVLAPLRDPRVLRQAGVAAVADHVDEARLGKRVLDLLHLADVVRRLVAPAALAVLFGVEPVEARAARRWC